MYSKIISFIRDTYQSNDFIPLHAPTFSGHEREYVMDTIDSTFVSSVGEYVNKFENTIARFTGAGSAVATMNGTAALHIALRMAGVQSGDLVITQPLTFVATCNALHHMGAEPVFIDVSRHTLGLCPLAVHSWLEEHAVIRDKTCIHRDTGRVIRAVVPMHTFGHPVQLDELLSICELWHLMLVEDAAESLGSYYKGRHTGTLAPFSALSFNGNKIVTTGGGGMILCQDQEAGSRAKHITTTAKRPHSYEFYHDEPGFNYRLPNLNAALGCAQMEGLPACLHKKRKLAEHYAQFFADSILQFVKEPEYAHSNYWLNAVICPDKVFRDQLLEKTNSAGVMTRPVWTLMHRLPMFEQALRGKLENAEWLEERVVNLPSTPTGAIA